MPTRITLLLTLIYLFASSLATVSHSVNVDCVYSMYVKTAQDRFAGTRSNISMTLYGWRGPPVAFDNLVKWGGAMGPNHTYFQRDSLDIFTGTAKCFLGPICGMNLTSDGTGPLPGWKCEYVKVAMFSRDRGCYTADFKVGKWLRPPNLSVEIPTVCPRLRAGENTFGPRKAFSQIVPQIV